MVSSVIGESNVLFRRTLPVFRSAGAVLLHVPESGYLAPKIICIGLAFVLT